VAPRNIEEGWWKEGSGAAGRVSGEAGKLGSKWADLKPLTLCFATWKRTETVTGFGPLAVRLGNFPAAPLTRFPAYDGSLATCITSVPGGISGETTLIRSPVAVRSRT
jgi:hypothetical protein